MFEIDENNLPIVRTRQALLALDLQNDFIATGSLLQIDNPPNFVENIVNVTTHFRDHGNVIWVRSSFEGSRLVNCNHGDSEKVITDRELATKLSGNKKNAKARPKPSSRLLESYSRMVEVNGKDPKDASGLEVDGEEPEISETYLTVEEGQSPAIVVPGSTGESMYQDVATAIDVDKDMVFKKNHYSAFKDGSLVQILRAKFVTEIYICGALTNIGVFATAMDAARYGYAITILGDCLGYRSKDRHDEALLQLSDFTGCNIISSSELIRELQQKSNSQRGGRKGQQPSRTDSSIEKLLSDLTLKRSTSTSSTNRTSTKPTNALATKSTEKTTEPRSVVKPIEAAKVIENAVEPETKKRDRVKTRVKTRRRAAEPSGEPKDAKSPVSATLLAASRALENLSLAEEATISSDQPVKPELHLPVGEEKRSVNERVDTEGPSSPQKSPDPAPKSEHICEGDTTIVHDLLNKDLVDDIFYRIRDEVLWQKMSHQGGDVPRLISVQGQVAADGSIPLYRHPADESPPLLPFSPAVSLIRKEVAKQLGHDVNHVLIQFYRNGTDCISEHSDKTLDIVPNSFIANVSLGAQRTLIFRTKKAFKSDGDASEGSTLPRRVCRVQLPHNSLCKMGLVTNMRWLHGIRQDKRISKEKSADELAYDGGRISLTFRHIGTFLDKDQQKIWGQGACSKAKVDAHTVINGNTDEAQAMLQAFGKENHSSEFDWAASYGKGFDVLHISNSPKVFLSGDPIADLRVKIILAAHGVDWKQGILSPSFNWKSGKSDPEASSLPEGLPVNFVDNDLSKSFVTGDLAIMLYIDSLYGPKTSPITLPQSQVARKFTRLFQVDELLKKWKAVQLNADAFRHELALWQSFAAESPFIAGSTVSLVDYALFPILDDMVSKWGPDECKWGELSAYYTRMKDLDCIKNAISEQVGET